MTHNLSTCLFCFRNIETENFDLHVSVCQEDVVLKKYRVESENSGENEQFMREENSLDATHITHPQPSTSKATLIPHPQPSQFKTLFSCNICEKGFASKASLKKHTEKVHEGKESKISLQHSEPSGFPVLPSATELTDFHPSQLRGIINEVRPHYHNSIRFMDIDYPGIAYKTELLEKKVQSYENPTILQNSIPMYFEEVPIETLQTNYQSVQCDNCNLQMLKEKDFFENFQNRTSIQIQYLCPHQVNIDSTVHEEKKPDDVNLVQVETEEQFVDSFKSEGKKSFQCKFCDADYDTVNDMLEHFNSYHEEIQVEIHEEKNPNEYDLSEKIGCKYPKSNNRVSQFTEVGFASFLSKGQ